MLELEVARTVEAHFSKTLELQESFEQRPRATISPRRPTSEGALAALAELRQQSAQPGGKLSRVATLGQGGMGVVHLATQSTLGRHVAVKTLHAEQADVNATIRLLREAWVTGALEHPNIIPVYDIGVDDHGAPVIVMKRVEGRVWSELMTDEAELLRLLGAPDPIEANLRVLLAVCNAVHFAHSKGILHRDIKPDNVMIGAFGEVYVLDWGLAVSLQDDPSGRLPSASQATELAGTPSYMAPEMLLGQPGALSPRTDVYLLGAVLYEIFAGRPPHRGDNYQALIASVLISSPAFDERFPEEARALCERALHREPSLRFEDAEELRLTIEEFLRHRGSSRLALDAQQSLDVLLRTLSDAPAGEERNLAVFNLLGECRFGYRAALSAWAGNEAARRGLDRALLAVAEHELNEGDPHAASLLLREVSSPPAALLAKVEQAERARAEEDERRRQRDQDHDASIGTRTRSALGALFGLVWTGTPLAAWAGAVGDGTPTHAANIGSSVGLIVIGALLWVWARDSLSKTRLNRGLVGSVAAHFGAQLMLSVGAYWTGMPPAQGLLLLILLWALTLSLLAIWAERWFALCALLASASFFMGVAKPSWIYALMAIDNAVLTFVVVRRWLPRADLEAIQERRQAFHTSARKLFLDLGLRQPEALAKSPACSSWKQP